MTPEHIELIRDSFRKLNPALYFVRLFMNLLLIGVLTFFVIHTALWLIRSRYDLSKKSANGGPHA